MNFSDCCRTIVAAFLAWVCLNAPAGAQTSIPGCYVPLRVASPNAALSTHIFVLVDQTVRFDANLRRELNVNSQGFVRAGNALTVLQFSAFNQNRYTQILLSGTVESLLDKRRRDATGAATLSKLDRCLALQQTFARRNVTASINQALSGASEGLSRSDIIASLKEISRLVAQSPAPDRVVLLASDMLENSSIATFYRARGVRRIDPVAELAKVERLGLLGDFKGARVFVMGAGLLARQGGTGDARTGNEAYRDPITMKALAQFWQAYFEKSNAKLVGFGTPSLLTPPR